MALSARLRNLLSAVALVLAAAAMVWVALAVGKRDEASEARKAGAEKVFGFRPDDVRALTVTARGETTVVQRDGAGWRVTSPPPEGPADAGAVDALVRRMADLRRKASFAPPGDADARRQHGLDPPRSRLEVTLQGGAREWLALGDENAFDATIFAESTSGAVDLVGPEARWGFERGAAELRARPPPQPAQAAEAAKPPK